MKFKQVIVLCFFIHFSLFSQYSKKVEKFFSEIPLKDSTRVVFRYKNGKVKKEFIKYFYNVLGEEFSLNGSALFYRKDGSLIVKKNRDRFGFLLGYYRFDKKERVLEYIKTEKIDTKNNTGLEFFNNEKGHTILTFEKIFYCDKKNQYLHKEGFRKNFAKTGIWRTYNSCGDTIRIKKYK